MRFYDTLTRSNVDFVPHEAGKVTIYTCGPTVYRHAHIGNLRTFCAADLLRRALAFEGLQVRHVMNITDVGHMTDDMQESGEDKMLLAVEDEGLTPAEIAGKYTEAFLRHCAAMNLLPAAVYPKATEHIDEMIDLTGRLIRRGHAYEHAGTVYYDVETFPAYGRLSNNTLADLETGHRLEGVDPSKRHHYDFTLWRSAGPRRLMKWKSPWGDGYPGWHIECSAMSMKHLGETFDIHTGGADLVFPHHEDEIAQSEGAAGHQVVRHWSHAHHLLSEGRKMAKSSGNYFVLDDLAGRGVDPLSFRYLILQTRYRGQMNFRWEALEAAGRGLEKLRKQMAEWAGGQAPQQRSGQASALDQKFRAAVADDLDTPQALVAVSELVASSIGPAEKFSLLSGWDGFLGLDLSREVTAREELPPGALDRINEREKARSASDWATADRIRAELAGMGVNLIDTPAGPRWTADHKA